MGNGAALRRQCSRPSSTLQKWIPGRLGPWHFSDNPTFEELAMGASQLGTPFTLPNTDIREAPTARVGADQIDTCATSQNWLVKDKPEGRYSAGASD